MEGGYNIALNDNLNIRIEQIKESLDKLDIHKHYLLNELNVLENIKNNIDQDIRRF